MTRLRTIPRLIALIALPFVFLGCSKDSPTAPAPGPSPATPTLQSVEIVGKTAFVVGETFQFGAIAKYSDGSQRTVTSETSWRDFDSGSVVVNATGLLEALRVGKCGVAATFQGTTATVAVVVTAAPPPGVPDGPGNPDDPNNPDGPGFTLLVEGPATVQVGGTIQWQAFLQSVASVRTNVTNESTWASQTPGIASINGTGHVLGVAAGTATLTATHRSRTVTFQVQVTAGQTPPPTVTSLSITGTPCTTVGGSAQLQAIAQMNRTAPRRTSPRKPHGRRPTEASRRCRTSEWSPARGAGSTQVTASHGGRQASVPVNVTASPAPPPPPPPGVDLIGLELRIAANVLSGNGPLGLNLELKQLLDSNPLLDLTVFGLYSDGSKRDVTHLAIVSCPAVPQGQIDCILRVDGMGTVEVIALLLSGLLDANHPVNVTYGGFTANVVIELQLPVLQTLGLNNGQPITLKAGNQLPSLQGLFSQGISSDIAANSPGITYQIQLADGLLTQLGSVPVIGGTLIGPVTTQLNQIVGGLSVVNGVLTLAPGLSRDSIACSTTSCLPRSVSTFSRSS